MKLRPGDRVISTCSSWGCCGWDSTYGECGTLKEVETDLTAWVVFDHRPSEWARTDHLQKTTALDEIVSALKGA
jgi:hypothetical protein